VCILFRSFDNRSASILFDLAVKLMLEMVAVTANQSQCHEFVNGLLKAVAKCDVEFECPALKYHVFGTLLEHLNGDEVFAKHDKSLSMVVLAVCRFYCSSLRVRQSVPLEGQSLAQLMAFVKQQLCMRPDCNLLSLLLEPFDPPSLGQSLILSLFQSQPLGKSSPNPAPHPPNTPLKLLTVILIEVLDHLFDTQPPSPLTPSSFDLIPNYFFRLLNFLENNRRKLKNDKIAVIESCLWHFYRFALTRHKRIGNFDDLQKSILYFSDDGPFQDTFAHKLMALSSCQPLLADLNGHPTLTADPLDEDFMGNTDHYLEESVGRIREAFKASKSSQSAVGATDRTVLDQEGYEGLVETLRTDFDAWVSLLALKHVSKDRRLLGVWLRSCKQSFGQHGPLFVESYSRLMKVGLPFELTPFDPLPRPFKFELNPYVTSELKRPFLRFKIKPSIDLGPLAFDSLVPQPELGLDSTLARTGMPFFSCRLIHQFVVKPVCVVLDSAKSRLTFFIDQRAALAQQSHFLKQFRPKPHQPLIESVAVASLKRVAWYKFMREHNSLCLVRHNRQRLILEFADKSHAQSFADGLVRLLNQSGNKHFSCDDLSSSLTRLVTDWRHNCLSNYLFLIKLNMLASRSFEDFSQYPVFPLVVKDASDTFELRELDKPVGMCGDAKRSSAIIDRFSSKASFDNVSPFHYGSHYSSPTFVFNFLVRLPPFDKGCRLIHNGSFDLADRTFFSLSQTLRNIREETGDLRELIPEFFSLPEMAINLNNLDFGLTHLNERVHHVVLPKVSKDNSYLLVLQLRELLESPTVTARLHNWVDLIFGFKQSGEQAQRANNLFFYLTYDKGSSLKEDPNGWLSDEPKESQDTQVFHFGQTPVKLFDTPLKARHNPTDHLTLVSTDAVLKYFVKTRTPLLKQPSEVLLMRPVWKGLSKRGKDTNCFVVLHSDKAAVWRISDFSEGPTQRNPFSLALEDVHKFPVVRDRLVLLGQLWSHRRVVEVFDFNKMVCGGLPNGTVVVADFLNDKVMTESRLHDCTVVALLVTPKGVLVSADESGLLLVSRLCFKTSQAVPHFRVLHHHGQSVQSLGMAFNDKQLFTVVTEHRVALWSTDEPNALLIDLPKHPFVPPHIVSSHSKAFFVFGHLNCLICYHFDDDTHHFVVVSLIGQVIWSHKQKGQPQSQFHHFQVVVDECFKEHLVCVEGNGNVTVNDLPLFQSPRTFRTSQKTSVVSVCLVNRQRSLLLIDDSGCIDVLCLAKDKT
jgi:hypothetical protein